MQAKKEGYVLSLDGVGPGQTLRKTGSWDKGHSRLYGGRTYAYFEEGIRIYEENPKGSDDQMVIGYHKGLPFQILVDGLFGHKPQPFEFIHQSVVGLMSEYADILSSVDAPNVDDVLNELIHKIADLRSQLPVQNRPAFTMAIAISYRKNNELYCAGFGVGDIGLLVRRQSDDEVKQLTTPTYFYGQNQFDKWSGGKDAFDDNFNKRPVTERCERFNIKIKPGDEIVGYTSLMYDLTELNKNLEKAGHGCEQRVLKPLTVLNNDLYHTLLKKNQEAYDSTYLQAQREKEPRKKFGDDCMIGGFTVPGSALQEELMKSPKARVLKDLSLAAGNIVATPLMAAGWGALVGTFLLPGIGTMGGAFLGGLLGAAIGFSNAGFIAVLRGQLVGGSHHKIETSIAAAMNTLGTAGLGALLGSFVFPGLGTLAGAAMGAGLGFASSSAALVWKKCFSKFGKKREEESPPLLVEADDAQHAKQNSSRNPYFHAQMTPRSSGQRVEPEEKKHENDMRRSGPGFREARKTLTQEFDNKKAFGDRLIDCSFN